jgi:hypothetical protein
VANGIVYAVGGFDYSTDFLSFSWTYYPQGTVEAYDPGTNRCTTKAQLPTPRDSLGVGVVNGVLYAVGGQNGSGSLTTVEAYDPVTDSWTVKAPLPAPREGLGVGVVNGVLYAGGGGSYLGTVEAYDPAHDR